MIYERVSLNENAKVSFWLPPTISLNRFVLSLTVAENFMCVESCVGHYMTGDLCLVTCELSIAVNAIRVREGSKVTKCHYVGTIHPTRL